MNLIRRAAPPLSSSGAGLILLKPRNQDNNKRVFSSAIEDWWIHIDEWDLAHPSARASAALYTLYREIWSAVNHDFQFRDELDHFTITHGPFRMRFDCEQGPIEWPDVAFIADVLASAAAMGWEGLYQLRFRHLRSPVIISIVNGALVWWWRIRFLCDLSKEILRGNNRYCWDNQSATHSRKRQSDICFWISVSSHCHMGKSGLR